MAEVAAPLVPASAAGWAEDKRQADRYFRWSVWLTGLLTVTWLYFVVTGRDGGVLFKGYQLSAEAIGRVAMGFLTMSVVWGALWYGIKVLLLRKLAGFSREEVRAVFRSRMSEAFDLQGLLARHSERRVRIADMIGRRGRFLTIGLLGFGYIYARVAQEPRPDFLFMGFRRVSSTRSPTPGGRLRLTPDGLLGRMAYGAQTRIMDGTLGRANCLVITMLWSIFKFLMVPIGFQLAGIFPPQSYAVVFAVVWLSYIASDGVAEIVGSLFGKQQLRVWGVGEVNKKSIAGTWACFLTSLAVCLGLALSNGLPPVWIGLAVTVSASNTFFELFSPRGTDDFTMATANALICWVFGAIVY